MTPSFTTFRRALIALAILAATLAAPPALQAAVKLPAIFGDHMVLQQEMHIYDGTDNGGFKERIDPATGWPIAGGSNLHPTGRPRVAERLTDIALVKTYGRPDRVVFGPMYDSHQLQGERILVKFANAGSGLATRDGQPPDWFAISDGSKECNRLKYVKARARIAGADTVEVWSAEVQSPKSDKWPGGRGAGIGEGERRPLARR